LDVTPITRKLGDIHIIILTPARTLHLWDTESVTETFISLTVPWPTSSRKRGLNGAVARDTRVQYLKSVDEADSFLIVSSLGDHVFVKLNARTPGDIVVTKSLEILVTLGCGTQVESLIRHSNADENEWDRFVAAIVSLCLPISETCMNTEFSTPADGHALWIEILELMGKEDKIIEALDDVLPNKWVEKIQTLAKKFQASFGDFVGDGAKSALGKRLADVLIGFHLLYEDLKLDVTMWDGAMRLGHLCLMIAKWVGWESWCQFYVRELGDIQGQIFEGCVWFGNSLNRKEISQPSIYSWVIESQTSSSVFPTLATLLPTAAQSFEFKQTQRVVSLYKILTHKENSERDLLVEMEKTDLDELWICRLPIGIASPIRDAIRNARERIMVGDVGVKGCVLAGREDVAELVGGRELGYKENFLGNTEKRTELELWNQSEITSTAGTPSNDENRDGTELDNDEITLLLFPTDLRIDEVRKILQSKNPVSMTTPFDPDLSDADLLSAQHTALSHLTSRILSLPSGRAALTFRTATPDLGGSIPVPPLTLAARFPPHNTKISSDTNLLTPDEIMWPNFHNGVAKGLAMAPTPPTGLEACLALLNQQSPDTTSAGVVLGLALNGHLAGLEATHLFGYLSPPHDLTTIAVLLGLSAANFGRQILSITNLLGLHFAGLRAANSQYPKEYNLPIQTQTAAVLGIGLLHATSGDAKWIHTLTLEIGRKEFPNNVTIVSNSPEVAANTHRPAYALAAGFAVGLVGLAKGCGERDRRLLERFVTGGVDDSEVVAINEMYASVNHTAFASSEGRRVNTDITGCAASVALALLFLESGERGVAEVLRVPASWFELDKVVPEDVAVRVVCRALVMGGVNASAKWVGSNVPAFFGLDGCEGKVEEAWANLWTKKVKGDVGLLRMVYCYTIAGAAFAIALRFAGSANLIALDLLLEYYDFFKQHSFSPVTQFLALVMAGTGNLSILKRFRKAHHRLGVEIPYSHHYATNLAIGLLFLGGCTHTFKSNQTATAVLFLSFYPVFPNSAGDNRVHLQTLRELWPLACEPRCIVARDVTTRKVVAVPARVYLYNAFDRFWTAPAYISDETTHTKTSDGSDSDGEFVDITLPCVVPPLDRIKKLVVDSTRYFPVVLECVNLKALEARSFEVVVKRRDGMWDYADDPHGHKTRATRNSSSEVSGILGASGLLGTVLKYTDNIEVEKVLRTPGKLGDLVRALKGDNNHSDALAAVEIVDLVHTLEQIPRLKLMWRHVWRFRDWSAKPVKALVDAELKVRIDTIFLDMEDPEFCKIRDKYFQGEAKEWMDIMINEAAILFGVYLAVYNLPSTEVFGNVRRRVEEFKKDNKWDNKSEELLDDVIEGLGLDGVIERDFGIWLKKGIMQ
ncbi:Anaphase-promoting complex subunit 1, partial [Nowakowskiella sp. JEL0078]